MKPDKAALDEFCAQRFDGLARTAFLITGDREEARDLAQEALTRAIERWRAVSKLDSPEAWLQRVVANLAISSNRRRRHLAALPIPPEQIASDLDTRDERLLEGLQQLTPAQRTAVVTRYYLDWSVKEVASALGKRPGTVRALTAQGIAQLREYLTDEEVSDEYRN
jgi:RNA polymerase sigma-70 factor (sigma-E family)